MLIYQFVIDVVFFTKVTCCSYHTCWNVFGIGPCRNGDRVPNGAFAASWNGSVILWTCVSDF